MMYSDIYKKLKSSFDKMDSFTEPEGLSVIIKKTKFKSSWFNEYLTSFPDSITGDETKLSSKEKLSRFSIVDDKNIKSNTSFDFYTFENTSSPAAPGVIFLFHGLNEKKWDKYLPWAYQLTKLTGKTVILFPMAFHMNRAPSLWSDSRLMQKLALNRANQNNNAYSSFVNAALSERLDICPQRLFLSGLQTYRDFYEMIRLIRSGFYDNIASEASIDLFGYSIGAFFSLLLLMDNPGNMLTDSRLFMFCGGATYDRTFPVSKYIVDRNASLSVSSFFDELFEDKKSSEEILNYYFNEFALKQTYFAGIMDYAKFKNVREKRLAEIYEQIYAVVLEKDDVVVPREVVNTLRGESRTCKTRIDIMNFDFPYNHVTPFPLLEKYKLHVDQSFKQVMGSACRFLS